MSLISSFPDELCELFSDLNDFTHCSFCTQYPVHSKATPLKNPIVVFGSESIKILSNTTDETNSVITDTRIAETSYTIGIHMPRDMGGTGCFSLLDEIIDVLLFHTNFGIKELSSEKLEYIRNTDSLYLRVVFSVDETLIRKMD